MTDDGSDEDSSSHERLRAELMRRHPEMGEMRAEYSGWLICFLQPRKRRG